MDELSDIAKYVWMLTVAAIGGLVGFITKLNPTLKGKALKERVLLLILGMINSMFIAYIVYEFCLYTFESSRLSIAFAGLASFVGTDLAVLLQRKFLELITRKIDGI